MEQESIQQVEPEGKNMRNEDKNNGKEDLGEGFKINKNGKCNALRFKM
jgi:hypothetical protein